MVLSYLKKKAHILAFIFYYKDEIFGFPCRTKHDELKPAFRATRFAPSVPAYKSISRKKKA